MNDEIIDIFDRVTGLYITIINKLKDNNKIYADLIQQLRVKITEKDAQINRLQALLNDAALYEEKEQEEHVVKTDYTIDAGIGRIGVVVSNLMLLTLVEELDEFIKKHGPQAAINVLCANK